MPPATTSATTMTQIHQVELPLVSAAGSWAGAVLGAGTTATVGAGAALVRAAADGPGSRVSSGAGLSGSGWPGSGISIQREISPSPYVSRVLKDSRVWPSGSLAIVTDQTASV